MGKRDKEMDIPSILIIDDDPALRKTLADILRVMGYETITASDGAEGLSLLRECKANVVLIDLGLPDMPGIDLLNRIKTDQPATEAIILTGNATLNSAIEATNSGAFSYLLKPYDIDQLLLQIRRAIEKQQAEEKVIERSRELEQANAELETLYEVTKTSSLQDPLTGLANRRALELQLEKSFEMAKRYAESFSVIMADIDHFKNYNDTHGHQAGDKLLIRIAEILTLETRSSDYAFRYGGEEFLIILTKTYRTNAHLVAEKLRAAVETKAGITISLGVASYEESMAGSEELVKMADAALYRAKGNGRNRVEVAARNKMLGDLTETPAIF